MIYVGLRSGGFVSLDPETLAVDASPLQVTDIAVGLAGLKRFSNQLHRPVTVAEHSVLGSYLLDTTAEKMQFLFHDAAEAVGFGDIHGPLKATMPARVRKIEAALQAAVFSRFDVPYPPSDRVTRADKVIGTVEYRLLHPARGRIASDTGYKPYEFDPADWRTGLVTQALNRAAPADGGEQLWLNRYDELLIEDRRLGQIGVRLLAVLDNSPGKWVLDMFVYRAAKDLAVEPDAIRAALKRLAAAGSISLSSDQVGKV